MTEKSIADQIVDIVKAEANNNPAPQECTVLRNYTGKPNRIDVTTPTGEYRYIPCIGSNTIGRNGILVFINGETPYAIIETRSI